MEAFAGKSAGLPMLLYDVYLALLRKFGSGKTLGILYVPIITLALMTTLSHWVYVKVRGRVTPCSTHALGRRERVQLFLVNRAALKWITRVLWSSPFHCVMVGKIACAISDGGASSSGRLSRSTRSEGMRPSKIKLSRSFRSKLAIWQPY